MDSTEMNLEPPGWLRDLFGPGFDSPTGSSARPFAPEERPAAGNVATVARESLAKASISSTRRGGWVLVHATLPDAVDHDTAALRAAVASVYAQIRETAESAGGQYPLRFWNFLPGIHDEMGDGLDRYKVFNAGRHDALSVWLESPDCFMERMPTATGVGHRGRDLTVYCLAGDRPGKPLENPRQRPAHQYSERYGPLPPCFSRAMRLKLPAQNPSRPGRQPALLVAGTASVRGEETVHVGCVERQLDETFDNLSILLESADSQSQWRARSSFNEMRVYHVDPAHRDWLQEQVRERFPGLQRLEMVRADICRPDLLVEIEGLARADT